MSGHDADKRYLDRAARAAMRGWGRVEPNPMVGAVIVKGSAVIGIGHHGVFGGLHAEREAIKNCRDRGHDPRGSTVYCTLEPCVHHGKQPPCTEALIESGVARVVYARRDPHEVSCGGEAVLRNAGIEVARSDASALAIAVGEAFVSRVQRGRPWVIAKWAQTLDGRIATRTGESQWISGAVARARVHRLRGRVDAVMVGVGTALADDPMLNARSVRPRRLATRVVLDSRGRLSPESRLVRTSGEIPTLVCTLDPRAAWDGVETLVCADDGHGRVDLHGALRALSERGVATLLVEAGPRVLGSLLEQELIDEAVVHIAPGVLGDEFALPVASGRVAPTLRDMRRFTLVRTKSLGGDVELHYRRAVRG